MVQRFRGFGVICTNGAWSVLHLLWCYMAQESCRRENFGGFLAPHEGTWRLVEGQKLSCVPLAKWWYVQFKRRSWEWVPLWWPVEDICAPLKGFLVMKVKLNIPQENYSRLPCKDHYPQRPRPPSWVCNQCSCIGTHTQKGLVLQL